MTTKAAKILALYEEGLSSPQIAERLGCHQGYVRAVKVRALDPRDNARRLRKRRRAAEARA